MGVPEDEAALTAVAVCSHSLFFTSCDAAALGATLIRRSGAAAATGGVFETRADFLGRERALPVVTFATEA